MRVVSWNLRRAKDSSEAWNLFSELNPDIALLQEVGGIPDFIKENFDVLARLAKYKTGTLQKFGTAVLVRGKIIKTIKLRSNLEWVNKELEFFEGNFVGCRVELDECSGLFNVVSVYAPAWPINSQRLEGVETALVRSNYNSDVWPIDILWAVLKDAIPDSDEQKWIAGGDFNASETFDESWGSGNKEFLERMGDVPLYECLREYNGQIVPTFRNAQNKKVIHQIDHLFVTENIFNDLKTCTVGDQSKIFGESISDHLPIVADFESI